VTGPHIAIDVTPLAGTPTGIANTIVQLLGALALLDEPPVMVPYAISTRARGSRSELPEDTRVVPGAGALARMWARSDRPRIDRSFAGAQLLHATNYLVPPTRLPTLITMYDCSIVRHRELCSPAMQVLEPVLRRAIGRGAHVHVPSRFVADEVEDLFGPGLVSSGRVHVVRLGIPPLAVPTAIPGELLHHRALAGGWPFVLAIGTIEPRKNLPHLVAAFERVAAVHHDLELVLAGPDGAARPEVDRVISRLAPDVAARVTLTGAVSDPARGWLIANAALLAYPSVYEGFGFPVLEAMAVGTPVIAANAGSIPEVAGDAAVLVEPTDEIGMSEALERVFIDQAVRDELVERGRAQAKEFRWDECATAIDSCYRMLCH
jgi:glycosyltransferase involved in cell wall biosynthesis